MSLQLYLDFADIAEEAIKVFREFAELVKDHDIGKNHYLNYCFEEMKHFSFSSPYGIDGDIAKHRVEGMKETVRSVESYLRNCNAQVKSARKL